MTDLDDAQQCNERTRHLVSDLIPLIERNDPVSSGCRFRFIRLIVAQARALKPKHRGHYQPSWRTVLEALEIVMSYTWRGDARDQAYFNRRIVEVLITCVESMALELDKTKADPDKRQSGNNGWPLLSG